MTFFTAATDRYLGEIGTEKTRAATFPACPTGCAFRTRSRAARATTENTSTFVLYRLLVNPDMTFEKLLGKENLKAAFAQLRERGDRRGELRLRERLPVHRDLPGRGDPDHRIRQQPPCGSRGDPRRDGVPAGSSGSRAAELKPTPVGSRTGCHRRGAQGRSLDRGGNRHHGAFRCRRDPPCAGRPAKGLRKDPRPGVVPILARDRVARHVIPAPEPAPFSKFPR